MFKKNTTNKEINQNNKEVVIIEPMIINDMEVNYLTNQIVLLTNWGNFEVNPIKNENNTKNIKAAKMLAFKEMLNVKNSVTDEA